MLDALLVVLTAATLSGPAAALSGPAAATGYAGAAAEENAGGAAPPGSGRRADAVSPHRSPVVTAPNPKAPPETGQFVFLVGTWDCTTRFLKPDGKAYTEGTAVWSGELILDGWAIQDWWIGGDPPGTFHGTNIRSFNPRTGKWDNRWLPSGSLEWKYYEAEKKGDTMVMTGGEGRDARGAYVDRNTFHDITPTSWKWRKDRSWDQGTTWVEGIGFIEARLRR